MEKIEKERYKGEDDDTGKRVEFENRDKRRTKRKGRDFERKRKRKNIAKEKGDKGVDGGPYRLGRPSA